MQRIVFAGNTCRSLMAEYIARRRFQGSVEATSAGVQPGSVNLISECLSHLSFIFPDRFDVAGASALRKSGRFGDLRKILRQIWISVQSNIEPGSLNKIFRRHIDELKRGHLKAQAEWGSILKEIGIKAALTTINGEINCRIPPAGFGLNTVYRLLVSHSGRSDYMKCLPMALFIEFESR